MVDGPLGVGRTEVDQQGHKARTNLLTPSRRVSWVISFASVALQLPPVVAHDEHSGTTTVHRSELRLQVAMR